jgi:hypothetical protein
MKKIKKYWILKMKWKIFEKMLDFYKSKTNDLAEVLDVSDCY